MPLNGDSSDIQGPRILSVPAPRAQDFLHQLQAHGLLDCSFKITKRDGRVFVPILDDPPFDLDLFGARWEGSEDLPLRTVSRDPWDRLREALSAAAIPLKLAPRRWKRIGDVLILRLEPEAAGDARTIAHIFGTVLGARTVVEDRSGIHGPLRTPDVRVLWGDGTETQHAEAGVRYALDVSKVMFSPGNVAERIGLAKRIPRGAVVVDLFAGIGYFSLPIAVRGRPEIVYACELNPASYAFLVRNIRLNRAENVVPLYGDCRDVAPRGVADWVLMGHFDARAYLDVAFAALRGRGTIVFHELCPKEQFPDAFALRLAAASRAHWMRVLSIQTHVVKSYAPGILHAVAEVRVASQMRDFRAKQISRMVPLGPAGVT